MPTIIRFTYYLIFIFILKTDNFLQQFNFLSQPNLILFSAKFIVIFRIFLLCNFFKERAKQVAFKFAKMVKGGIKSENMIR